MRTILYFIRKEFIQIFRDKFIGKAIFAVPLVQLLILVPAVTFEIKNVNLCVIDRDMSADSRKLISQLEGSTFFKIKYLTFSEEEANTLLQENKCDMVLQIPSKFGKNIGVGEQSKIMVSINAINATTAQLSLAYLNGVIQNFNMNIAVENAVPLASLSKPQINISSRHWYNETLNYSYFMLPGILAILVTVIGFLLAGLNFVKEKEVGTIEQINVTPIKKYQFITAKMFPFLVISLFDLALGLLIGRLFFGVPFQGSIGLLFLCSAVFLISVLGLALFISTYSSTQQQFMFVAFFFMIIFILMSGIFTPLESMPQWAQKVNLVNPMVYLIRINRMVMLKGSGFHQISSDLYALIVIATSFTFFAVKRYRKTS
ncbi:MAG: ABC transporter permease [Bacteroidales bacterium]|jgi:ABC-2 type transport system permease protein|nr:ABC transporter permease [Bacteroidales bacterium]MDD4385632.1 ABC transporter permease [Bacteroidales bacterium]MDY0196893.1 ABC transporter permease [Tenuifilaceae bacterium]